jgi:hypothetical protein
MPILDLTKKSYNFESSRVEQLFPRELRRDSATLIEFLKEYYRFMNQNDGTSSGPSYEISRANEQHDLDLIEDKYVVQLKALLAPYVPNSDILENKQLLKLIVKFFYNNRGSRESVETFFRLFFNTTVQIIDNIDIDILYTEEITEGNSTYQNILAKSWRPYSYGIATDIQAYRWQEAYKALVHPIGWRFFPYLSFELFNTNKYVQIPSTFFDYNSNFLKDWFYIPPAGSHTPTAQHEVYYMPVVFSDLVNPYDTSITQPDTIIHLEYTTIPEYDRMDLAKFDYVSFLKFEDYAEMSGYGNFTIDGTTEQYPEVFSGDFANVSSIVMIDNDNNFSFDGNDTTPPIYENENSN